MSVIESQFAVLALEQVAEVDAHEGPVYVEAEDALYFTTLPKPGPEVAIKRLSLAKPNGLAFSPDESILYVGDSGANHEPGSFNPRRPHHIRAFDVADGKRLENGRLFAVTTPGFPDGVKVDADGRVYASCFSGVQVFAPDGELVHELTLAGAVNFAFAGTTLYVTTDTAIWAATLSAKGA